MSAESAVWILGAVGTYLAAGALFALAFLASGLARIDAGAQGMPWTARLLIAPGVAALWPLMLLKWLKQREPPVS